MLVHLAYGVAGAFAFAAEQPEKRRSETREDQQMSATLELTHKAIGAEVRRGIYDVVFNGERVGSVEMSNTIEIPVEPGRHTLQVRNGRNSSSTQTFDAATLFNPLRRRTQRAVDRRSNRARYDAEATVATFAAGLKDAVNLDSVRDDLASVVQKALEPAHISSWA
ncbi:MAG TPA: hypothetical protein VEF71_10360 [Streptosporangiaceae bacterium]|nr:hypothetical protein [Streptosporangiaceae bacterium]